MNSPTFEALHDYFISQLAGLQTVLDLRDAIDDESCLEHLEILQKEIRNVDEITAKIRREQEQKRQKIHQLKNLNLRLHELIEKCEYSKQNIPDRLPKPATDRNKNLNSISTHQKSSVAVATNQITVKDEAPPPVSKPPVLGKQANIYFPEIEYLTVDEFEQVPKYLKGRLVYNQINKFIEGMNVAYKAKYSLLKKKKSTLNDQNRKRVEQYKQQDIKDTKGCYFIVEEDVKLHGTVKIDAVARNILNILRQCNRIREVRGGKLTRYVFCDHY